MIKMGKIETDKMRENSVRVESLILLCWRTFGLAPHNQTSKSVKT